MRLLEYRQELFGNGYTVSSSNSHYEDRDGRSCLPIIMKRLECGEPFEYMDDLIENIHFNWNTLNGTEEEHRRKYADIFLGHNPAWRLIAFQVQPGRLYLDYCNTVTGETTFLYLTSGSGEFTFRFKVPHTHNNSCSTYDVSIESKGDGLPPDTCVTECFGGVRREIHFIYKSLENDKVYIEVTEYADF